MRNSSKHASYDNGARPRFPRAGLAATLVTAMALLCASGAGAADVSIYWLQTAAPVGYGYLPHLASDGWGSFVSIYQTTTGFADFAFQTGYQESPDLFWNPCSFINSPTQTSNEVGHSPAIAMVPVIGVLSSPTEDYMVEVHQGGQDDGAALWFRAGQTWPSQVEPTGSVIAWQAAQKYDAGFNPAVAVDQYCSSCAAGTTTIVEVHQSQANASELWFHVGTFNGLGTSTPTVSFGPATQFDPGFEAYAPSVSIADGLIVLVGQGSGGSLWRSIGVLQGNAIAWSAPETYDYGYNPSISLVGCTDCGKSHGLGGDWDLVEVHQALNNETGALWYRTARLKPSPGASYPTKIVWTPDAATQYADEGCYPAITQMPFPPNEDYEVVETHSMACNEPAYIVSAVGSL
jgi:hypothetical protein